MLNELIPSPDWGEEGKDWMRVPLVNGGWCVVDAEDYEKAACRRWQICQREGWASRVVSQSRPTVLLYKIVVDMPRLARIAFIDGNPLNHRKVNLHLCSTAIACFNCGLIYRKKASRLIEYKTQFCSVKCRDEFSATSVEAWGRRYRGVKKSADMGRVYTPELIRRISEWDGEGCAFPLCEKAKSRQSKWPLCPLHRTRFEYFRADSKRHYQRRLNELI